MISVGQMGSGVFSRIGKGKFERNSFIREKTPDPFRLNPKPDLKLEKIWQNILIHNLPNKFIKTLTPEQS
jgi:hypothetical protein